MRRLIFGRKYVQSADLNNSLFINNVAKSVTINGVVTRTTDHKGRNTAIQFGSGNLVSVDNLPASPVWSVAFWLKSGANSTQNINIINNASNTNGDKIFLVALNVFANNGHIGGYAITHNVSFDNVGRTNEKTIMDNQWRHYVVIFDTSQPANDEIKVYINKVQKTLVKVNNTNTSYSFKSSPAKIGVGLNSTQSTSPIKMFNYPLTQTEIDNLYNE